MFPPQQQQDPNASAGQGQTVALTDLKEAFTQALKGAQPQAPPQQQQLSPEQIKQMLRTYTPDQSLHDMLFGENLTPDQRISALNNMVQGIVSNATAHAQVLVEDYLQRYHQEVSPTFEDAKYLSQQRFYDDLYQGNDGLKQYDPMIRQLMPQFESQPDYPADRGKRSEYVRNKSIELLKQTQPTFDPTKGQAPTSGQSAYHNSPATKAPSLSSFGGGGGQGGAAKPVAPASTTPASVPEFGF